MVGSLGGPRDVSSWSKFLPRRRSIQFHTVVPVPERCPDRPSTDTTVLPRVRYQPRFAHASSKRSGQGGSLLELSRVAGRFPLHCGQHGLIRPAPTTVAWFGDRSRLFVHQSPRCRSSSRRCAFRSLIDMTYRRRTWLHREPNLMAPVRGRACHGSMTRGGWEDGTPGGEPRPRLIGGTREWSADYFGISTRSRTMVLST
jgi:hypothetical protein